MKAKSYFNEYQHLNDSLQRERNRAKNQFAFIRFETDKKQMENETLKVKEAQSEVKLLRVQILVGILFIGFIFMVYWYQKRKTFQEQKERLQIKKTKLNYSKKVHDIIANGIYRILSEVENAKTINKEVLLDRLETIYEKSRDLSYDHTIPTHHNFYEEIKELITSYANDHLQILIINDEKLWETVNLNIQNEIKMIVQEFLVNLKKHSQATFATFSFEKQSSTELSFTYSDNGIGISCQNLRKGNGLKNVESRIFSLNGNINFVENVTQGTKINLKIPM